MRDGNCHHVVSFLVVGSQPAFTTCPPGSGLPGRCFSPASAIVDLLASVQARSTELHPACTMWKCMSDDPEESILKLPKAIPVDVSRGWPPEWPETQGETGRMLPCCCSAELQKALIARKCDCCCMQVKDLQTLRLLA